VNKGTEQKRGNKKAEGQGIKTELKEQGNRAKKKWERRGKAEKQSKERDRGQKDRETKGNEIQGK
jgi:hypothetical protein